MKLTIPAAKIQDLFHKTSFTFPKYTTQIINLANRNAQGTRPAIVGQMSDLIQKFEGFQLDEWRKWYLEDHPDAIDEATIKIWDMIEKLKQSIAVVDKNMVRNWVEDLIIVKTFVGLKCQEAILKKIAFSLSKTYRLAKPQEESKGIDGYINNKPVSIKPGTYRTQRALNEIIDVPLVFYMKIKAGVKIEFQPTDFD